MGARMFEITPLTILFGGGCVTMLGWILAGKAKVNQTECDDRRKIIEENHRNTYMSDRRILLVADHEKICATNTGPIKEDIAEIKKDLKELLKRTA